MLKQLLLKRLTPTHCTSTNVVTLVHGDHLQGPVRFTQFKGTKDEYELKLQVIELESKANMQKEVMSNKGETRSNKTRLLSFSLL
nr:hypothetical protein [Tanacetum cinerariifolium]